MDPSTVIIILATHLICSGGLYYLISRDMPPRSGLVHWAAGGVLFGVAYIARLVVEKRIAPPWTVATDSAMVLAVLLFVAGLRQFTGRSAGRWPLLAGAIGAYATAHLVGDAAVGRRRPPRAAQRHAGPGLSRAGGGRPAHAAPADRAGCARRCWC